MDFYQRLLAKARHESRQKLMLHEEVLRRLGYMPKPSRKRPPEAGLAVPAVTPRGPRPLSGGAQAPLNFEND